MALTKLPKSAFGTDSIDDTKIEDGTIQNQELAGSLSEDRIATGTIANASLSNSTITINGTSISLGGSSSVGVDVNWQSVQTTGFTAVAGNGYFVDTTSGAITVTLPASASLGDQIAIKDYAGTFASNNLTIGRNGHNIQGVANDSLISTNRASLLLVYVDATKGWIYAEESNVADLQANTFISATGGTITTSGDFKIHTFTGDGCFAVSTIGAGPTGGPANIDYLVVAGGAAGGFDGGGGGGAGGYRTTFPSPGCNAGSFPISSTTYPITVGAGGATNNSPGVNPGSNGNESILSTITSAGGGTGAGENGCAVAQAGGSGGGGIQRYATDNPTRLGGSGNTPPVSPPQGNDGGDGYFANGSGCNGQPGGGGGATAAGADGGGPSPGVGSNGGAGAPNAITGTATSYAGGGGGTAFGNNSNAGGTGGAGGGGNGASGNGGTLATAGTANTGGGGGGSQAYGGGCRPSGAGGSGIVIIRYKFQ
jgi:hypothetical protein